MNDLLERLGGWTGLPPNVVGTLGAVLLVLAVGSAVRLAWLFLAPPPPEKRGAKLGSLLTWWVLFIGLVVVLVLGKAATVALFAFISLLALREFDRLASRRTFFVWGLAYLAVPLHYLAVYFDWLHTFWTFVPVWVFVVLLVWLVGKDEAANFLETAGVTFLGLMLLVYLFSHAALLLSLPEETKTNRMAGTWGLLLYLLLLTEGNDIAQALWGRQLGRHKIAPRLSPNKTWEGFLLGLATTVAFGCLLAPVLTPFADPLAWAPDYVPAVAAALLIGVSGYFGDVTLSAVKREVGVKDSGTVLPGQGGILDRIDSLTFTAPVFFYFTYLLYGP